MLRRSAMLLAMVALASCVGTYHSRGGMPRGGVQGQEQRDTFGWPLYAAVGYDLEGLADGRAFGCRGGELERWLLFPSVPIDFVLDTVLLPLDVVCGLSGMDRRPRQARDVALPPPLPFRPSEQDR
jgi:uncharacterized protein YceK